MYLWNKNDNIRENKAQSDDKTNIDKYRVAANITEYHSLSKLIFLRIIIKNGRTAFWSEL